MTRSATRAQGTASCGGAKHRTRKKPIRKPGPKLGWAEKACSPNEDPLNDSTIGEGRKKLRLLLLQFGPARVERIHGFLSLVQFGARVLKVHPIAGDGRIFKCGSLSMKDLLRFVDAIFDRRKFPRLAVREFLFCSGTRGFVHCRARRLLSIG